MECLTPPLDSVPVEEWFCPECEATNRRSRVSAEELSDTESLPSTARPATSRFQFGAAGPTRAIARTQQSERVRANVNRHRITQARSSQLAPTFLIQSTWLDDTINAVVAGLNTAVYIRDFTPRPPTTHRRKTRKRRKVRRKTTSSAKSKTGKAATTGVKRRKRRVRRTKSRRRIVKKPATARSRIANTLRIVKDKKGSSLPSVYRPAENTLSNMRADIGAASLSIHGDQYDLDPLSEREEVEQQARVTSLLEAKRRGISRSALRSHQPVARPVTAGHSRRGMDVPQSAGFVEAAPVPDLLGSILSGQSVLLMNSCDVVINRDGSLKATKSLMQSELNPGHSNDNSSGDASTQISPMMSPNQGDSSPSLPYNVDQPGSSHSYTNRPLSQSSSHLPLHTPLQTGQIRPSSQLPLPIRPTHPHGHQRSNGAPSPSLSTKSKEMASSQSQKAPAKPMWVDVSVLPRIPKIKRESGDVTNNGTNQDVRDRSSSSSSSRGSSSNSTTSRHGHSLPETGMNSLAGDRGRQQSVDQQKGRAEGQRQTPEGPGSSSAFSNSFSSSSSSSMGSSASQSRYSSSASSSSSVSFRINTSGNTWQPRQVGSSSLPVAGSSTQPTRAQKENEAKKRQLHRDKQKLLASRTAVKQEESSDTIYDPFDPTLSDSSSSDNEAESARLHGSCQNATHEEKASSLVKKSQRQQDLVTVKTESQDIEVSQEEPMRADAQESTSQEVRFSETYVKVETKSRLIDMKSEKTTSLLASKVKIELGLVDAGGAEIIGSSVESEKTEDTSPPVQHRLDLFKTKREEESAQRAVTPNTAPRDPSASSSTPIKKEQKPETKSDSKSSHKSRDLGQKKKTFQASKERRSKSPETDRGKRGDRQASGPGGRQKEKSSRRSRSRERTGAHSVSESSQSPVRKRPKRQRSCSQSKERRRSRSGSGSSSRERSRKKKPLQRSKERSDGRDRDSDRGRESKDKRRGRGRSRSRSKSRSRSVSRERKKGHTRLPQPSLSSKDKEDSRSKDKMRRRSRSSSREKRKEEGSSSKSAQRTSGSRVSSSKDTKRSQDRKKAKDTPISSIIEEHVAPVIKQKTPSHTPASEMTKKDPKVESQDTTAGKATEIKVEKEMKKEKRPSLDMFEDVFSISEQIKKEESDIHAFMVAKSMDEKGKKEDPIKTEKCKIPIIKSEPSSPTLCHSPPPPLSSSLTTPVPADSLQDTVSDPELTASSEQPDSVKQEVQEPSDSDDDFNVDVMLDSLDYVKTERSEESGASVKQEGEEEEEEEGKSEQISTVAKSKTQGKRVTWNIQEPDGPQPEKKSASKLSLYKLKLKQEGARRPSSTGQTSSQVGQVSPTNS
ncbi:PHD and RING finger domain-containing protein 1 isoform X2 [Notothenia coriiceps]|nr:PREDICTED: PHD and RING finger domain-containing protein 1 isoform X2 [Notothenia coriiceps]